MGESKFAGLGWNYAYQNVKEPEKSDMEKFRQIFKAQGIECVV